MSDRKQQHAVGEMLTEAREGREQQTNALVMPSMLASSEYQTIITDITSGQRRALLLQTEV